MLHKFLKMHEFSTTNLIEFGIFLHKWQEMQTLGNLWKITNK
jgi:hypothetical protein